MNPMFPSMPRSPPCSSPEGGRDQDGSDHGRRALITGITGQDGSYLGELLLQKGYRVWGMVRRSSTGGKERLEHLLGRIALVSGDITDLSSLLRLLGEIQPDEVYNLAAQSFVPTSWQEPLLTAQTTALGVLNCLEAIRLVNPKIRFYQASSSEMFGKALETPQTEATHFHPRSPYGVSKLFGHWATVNYRESYGIYACSGILFNHESPRRGQEFVSRKVTLAAARIALGLEQKLFLGNLDARRDWGFAGDYVEAMWRMLQCEAASDFVVATGVAHTVRELVEVAFERAGLDWRRHVEVDPKLARPAEVDCLVGDASRARRELKWEPKMDFKSLVEMMVESDLAAEGESLGTDGRSRISRLAKPSGTKEGAELKKRLWS